jgi:hypothetical protein
MTVLDVDDTSYSMEVLGRHRGDVRGCVRDGRCVRDGERVRDGGCVKDERCVKDGGCFVGDQSSLAEGRNCWEETVEKTVKGFLGRRVGCVRAAS